MNDEKPVIRVLLHDVLAVLEGRTMTVNSPTGEVALRLFTAEEFLAVQHAAVDSIRPGNDGAKIDLARARDLTQPLKVTSAEPVS